LLALLSLTEALTLKANVKILGGSGKQSKNVQDYISQTFFQSPNAPAKLWAGDPLATLSRFTWGNSIEALMASQNSARGPHIPRLRLDEADEMSLSILDAAMGQTMSKVDPRTRAVLVPANTTISSTHHNPDGTMTEILKRSRERGWSVHEWSYAENMADGGWLLPSEVAAKKGEVTAMMWQVEYELQEPSSEGVAIDREAVEAMFSPKLGEYPGKAGEYIEIQAPRYKCSRCGYVQKSKGQCPQHKLPLSRDGRYVTGAAWAKKMDYTDIVTFRTDVTPHIMVAYERRQREPWPRMVGRFDARLERFGGKAAHDGTGVGDVVEDYMSSDARAVIMTGNARKNLFTDYIAAIEDGQYVAPRIETMYNEYKYATVDSLFGAGHPPDSFVAGAMAHKAESQHKGGRGV